MKELYKGRLKLGNKGKIYKFKAKKKKKQRKKINKKLLIIGAFMVYLFCFFSYQGFQIYVLKKQEKKLNQEKQTVEQQKMMYQKQLDQINSPEYIEKMARQSLRMIMPNEILYVPQERFVEDEDVEQESEE